MKKKIVESMLLFIITCSISGYCYCNKPFKPDQLVVENDNAVNDIMEVMKEHPTIETAAVNIVKSNEEPEVISQPVVFPDKYYDPEKEEFREEEFWDDMELVALVCVAEAEGESEYGKRLVIDTIFNRMDSQFFPADIKDIIYAPGQWECVSNGRINHVEYDEYIANLVLEEYENRTNSDVLYFRTDYYFNFGTPLLQEGSHYFSGR